METEMYHGVNVFSGTRQQCYEQGHWEICRGVQRIIARGVVSIN